MAEHHQAEEEEEAIDQSSDENMELEQLEEDVKLMALKIAEFRDTLPDQLQNTLASILTAQRPLNFNHSDSNGAGASSSNPTPDSGASVEDDLAHARKIQAIKQKISDNKSAMSSQLKRMKDCMSRIDKLDSFNKGIHPAFKRGNITSKDCFMYQLCLSRKEKILEMITVEIESVKEECFWVV